MGKLHTCYAPVRRSPSNKASFVHAAPRLACVKPIASVHPEPGSNSSLYIYLFFRLLLKLKRFIVVNFFRENLSRFFLRSAFQVNLTAFAYRKNWRWYFLFTLYLYYIFVVFNLSKNSFPFSSKRTAKLRHFFELTKYFKKNIYFSFQTSAFLTRRQPLSIADAKVQHFLKPPKYFHLFL